MLNNDNIKTTANIEVTLYEKLFQTANLLCMKWDRSIMSFLCVFMRGVSVTPGPLQDSYSVIYEKHSRHF